MSRCLKLCKHIDHQSLSRWIIRPVCFFFFGRSPVLLPRTRMIAVWSADTYNPGLKRTAGTAHSTRQASVCRTPDCYLESHAGVGIIQPFFFFRGFCENKISVIAVGSLLNRLLYSWLVVVFFISCLYCRMNREKYQKRSKHFWGRVRYPPESPRLRKL